MGELRDTGHRYEMDEEGLTSWADYRRSGERLYIDHVESPPALRGTGCGGPADGGAGRRRAGKVAEDHADLRLRRQPWLRRSEEFADLVG